MNLSPQGVDRPWLGRVATTLVATCAVMFATVATASAAPTVTTLPFDTTDSSLISFDYALVSGIVNPNGQATVYFFQYGTTTDYGSVTPTTSASNGKADVNVDISLDDLAPSTLYHYRLVAQPDPALGPYYGIAQTTGADETFTTTAAPAVSFKKKAKVKGGKAQVKVTATGADGEKLAGRIVITAKLHKKLKTIGAITYKVPAGSTKTVKVPLSPGALKALKKHGKLKAKAKLKTKGIKKPVSHKLTLTAG
ncbi:MAG: hypothetical protein QOF76_965 [Solirubrobacteraceae bacterium]|jgi:hypothetical protein|nr:hypothetical protein [Solirubrobacteraceae bacterium]